jgi:hypothetical protein
MPHSNSHLPVIPAQTRPLRTHPLSPQQKPPLSLLISPPHLPQILPPIPSRHSPCSCLPVHYPSCFPVMHRLFVEKTASFANESSHLIADLRSNLAIETIASARIVQRYDLDGLTDAEFSEASHLILSEPQVETSSTELSLSLDETAFAVEFLPGQFDQRADSAAQCVQILTGKDRPFVSSARIIILKGPLSSMNSPRLRNTSSTRSTPTRSPSPTTTSAPHHPSPKTSPFSKGLTASQRPTSTPTAANSASPCRLPTFSTLRSIS